MSTPATPRLDSDVFDAEAAVAGMSIKIPEKFGGDGTTREVPEPSSEMVAIYFAEYAKIMNIGNRTFEEREGERPEERDARLREHFTRVNQRNLEVLTERREILSALCSNVPTVEELAKLPYRVFNAWEGYVMRGISPEA